MLKGLDLSEVQAEAVEVLMLRDDIQEYRNLREDENRKLKLALLARSEFSPSKLFPAAFDDGKSESNEDSDDVEYDYSRVEWKSPKDMDAEETEKLMAIVHKGAARMDFSQVESQYSQEWV